MAISKNNINSVNKRRFALIIANSDYQDPDLHRLCSDAGGDN